MSDRTLFFLAVKADAFAVKSDAKCFTTEVSFFNGVVSVWNLTGRERKFVGSYVPGGSYDTSLAHKDFKEVPELIRCVSLFVSLINQPRFVVEVPAISRQLRRQIQRRSNQEDFSPVRVEWNIGERVKDQLRQSAPERCMPLHFRRGHWRRAESHFVGAVQRTDAIFEADRDSWWQWISEIWVGHPAYGFKKSVHAPYFKQGFGGFNGT
jgi:hypothetical protein